MTRVVALAKILGKQIFSLGRFPEVGQKQKTEKKKKKRVGPAKYWGKQIFSLGIFSNVGQKLKTEKQKERETKSW